MRMRMLCGITPVCCLAVLLVTTGSTVSAAEPAYDAARTYVHPADFDFETLLGDPPADNSPEHASELATELAWQNRRTTEDVNRCRLEAKELNVWLFADVLGDDFNPTTHPLTASLFDEVFANTEPVVKAAKKHWNRTRPTMADVRIHPCVSGEVNTSYPGGHAAQGRVDALILAEIFPAQRTALMARGKLIGTDRLIAGLHWTSDIVAGEKLGTEIARRLLDNQDFQYELQRAEEECHAGTAAAGNQPTTRPAEATTQSTQP